MQISIDSHDSSIHTIQYQSDVVFVMYMLDMLDVLDIFNENRDCDAKMIKIWHANVISLMTHTDWSECQ